MNVVKMPKYPCPFCKKNESTQFCDFVIDYTWTSMQDSKGRMIGARQITCDNQMCTDCLKKVSCMEFCPKCYELYEYVQKNHKRMPGRLMWDSIHGKTDE
jgi:hypothetical protein